MSIISNELTRWLQLLAMALNFECTECMIVTTTFFAITLEKTTYRHELRIFIVIAKLNTNATNNTAINQCNEVDKNIAIIAYRPESHLVEIT